ncbi:SDR family oxidoreductase [Herbidospora yilanensis]|uniref:SDR family oxidoreductase n=1 Tax=Herbidospora yilanensis TaxID=354426 RepID=UPI00078284D2|nr:SDR family oxidoreductase [Herbidospora yilanensis]
MSKEFLGRRAVVTGGSQGIGAAVARRLLDGGARVVVTAPHRVPETPGDAILVEGDPASLEGAGTTAEEALGVLGGCDILVNNAGAMPDEAWQDSIDGDFLSAVRMTAALMPALRRSGHAAIVNVSAHCRVAEAALNTYTRSLARELAPQGIRVTIVTQGEPSEVAELVAMLASDRGRWMTGADYHVDGGSRAL